MTETACRPDQLAHRQTATFHFVPFVARLFTEGPLRGATPPLPGDPDAHTAEAVARLREIWKRAAWRFLARAAGWRALPVAFASGPGTTARLWQTALPPLRFTADAMRLCLVLYNSTRQSAGEVTLAPPPCDTASGDLLLHHLVFTRLRENPLLAGLPARFDWSPWVPNPLNTAADPLVAPVPLPPECWDRLTRPDLSPFLPWLLTRWTRHWSARDAALERENFAEWKSWQAALRRVVEGIAGALDRAGDPVLWLPLLAWFPDIARSLPRALRIFDSHTRHLRLTERHAASGDWHAVLGLAETLDSMAADFTTLHPADREPCHRAFLAATHSSGFSEALPALRAARQTLRPVLS